MIKPRSLSSKWITEKSKQFGKDPTIIQGMIYALYLLEYLKLSGLNFIFKGGTSLVLLLNHPKRFSVDIDIIPNPPIIKVDLESYLGKIVDTSSFIRSQKSGDWWNTLNKEELEAIERGLKDLEDGKIHSHETARKVYVKYL